MAAQVEAVGFQVVIELQDWQLDALVQLLQYWRHELQTLGAPKQ